MKKVILIFTTGLLFLLAACSNYTNGLDIIDETNIAADANGVNGTVGTSEVFVTTNALDYPSLNWQTITAIEALNMMAELDNFILLDVRTVAEYQEVRIDGAVLIPYNAIKNRAVDELPDKNTVILLYCRSGRRSALAAADLVTLGFTNIYDFGGIINWPYESVSG